MLLLQAGKVCHLWEVLQVGHLPVAGEYRGGPAVKSDYMGTYDHLMIVLSVHIL